MKLLLDTHTILWFLGDVNKLTFEGGMANFFMVVEDNGFAILPIKREYVIQLGKLPLHHRDPFDRMLIAFAMAEGMNLISTDKEVIHYGVSNIW